MNEQNYPSLIEQGKNLSKFAWDILNYVTNNQEKVLFVSDDVYKERVDICKSCDKYHELENRCVECGCYVPAKAKIILDSCPLNKWSVDDSSWDNKFDDIITDIQKKENT